MRDMLSPNASLPNSLIFSPIEDVSSRRRTRPSRTQDTASTAWSNGAWSSGHARRSQVWKVWLSSVRASGLKS